MNELPVVSGGFINGLVQKYRQPPIHGYATGGTKHYFWGRRRCVRARAHRGGQSSPATLPARHIWSGRRPFVVVAVPVVVIVAAAAGSCSVLRKPVTPDRARVPDA